ncbi:hypothetical protein niasHT_039127 [Heterodera trifolii]|uniref:Uncharacterized protein n=1 Tax=Heterodera trifolii TaxID=157864 RepID=A0ABD2I477_9BILA
MPQDFISATNIGTPENEGLTLATAVNPRNCSIKQIEALLVADMAGRAIELLLIGESHGDEGDVEEATVNARELNLAAKKKGMEAATRKNAKKALDRAINEVIDESTEAAKEFLEANWSAIERFAIVLHERKTINADEAEEILGYYL